MKSQEKKITIKINGIEIEITGEMKRSWYKMINDTRNDARKNGTCGQTSYWRCNGDCAICPWHFSGIFVSYLLIRRPAPRRLPNIQTPLSACSPRLGSSVRMGISS